MITTNCARTHTPPVSENVGLQARELSPTMVLVAVSGEVDAATETSLLEGIVTSLRHYRQLVLDLSRVRFFGTAGYTALRRLDSRSTRSGVDWVLIGGPEVTRLMRLCDPDGLLPTAANIVSAVATLARGPHRTPQLRSVPTN